MHLPSLLKKHPMQHPDRGWDIFERETCSSAVNSSWKQVNAFDLKFWKDGKYFVFACTCLGLPSDRCKRLLGVCSREITRSSPPPRASPGYLPPARRLLRLSSLLAWLQPIPCELLYLQTHGCDLVHRPPWASKVWLQSRGSLVRGQWVELINQACQIEWGLAVSGCPPKTSWFVWSSAQIAGYLPEMAATGCSSLSLFTTPEGFVEALQEVYVARGAWCIRVEQLNRNHSGACLAGVPWKPLFVSSKQGEDIYLRGGSWHYFWDNGWLLPEYQRGLVSHSHFPMLQPIQVVKDLLCHLGGVTPVKAEKW